MCAVATTIIPKLSSTVTVGNTDSGSIPVLAFEFLDKTSSVAAIRCSSTTNEIWLTSTTLPSTSTEEVTGVLKYSFLNKTPESLANEINSTQTYWKVYPLLFGRVFTSKELWNYFYEGGTPGTWSNYTGNTYTPDQTFDNKFIVRANRFSVLYFRQSIIEAIPPDRESLYAPWYCRVSNGTFILKDSISTYLYTLPEYKNSLQWSHISGKPFVYVHKELPIYVDSDKIETRHKDIRNVKVEIDGNLQFVKEIYPQHGIIILNKQVDSISNIQVSYEYREENYIFKDIDLNPRNNSYINGKIIIIYLLPEKIITGTTITTTSRTLYYTIGSTMEEAYHKITNQATAVIIGILKANNFASPTIVDLRSPGGGAYGNNLRQEQIESEYYTDIVENDGKQYPGNGAILIEIPAGYSVEDVKKYVESYVAYGTHVIIKRGSDG